MNKPALKDASVGNSTASKDQLLSFAVFDSRLLPIFPEAVNVRPSARTTERSDLIKPSQCGIVPLYPFPAGDHNQASLQQTTVNDPYNAMARE